MQFTKVNDHYVIRLQRTESVHEVLHTFLQEQGITAGTLQAIGAVEQPTISFYELATKTYNKQTLNGEYEVLSLLGNISLKDGKPFAHMHITLGDSTFATIGGHLNDAIVSITLEVIITPLATTLNRVFDEETGLHLLDI